MYLGIGLSIVGRYAAGGGAPVAPVIVTPGSIDAQPLVGQVVLVTGADVTGADSVAYQWYRGVPPTTPIGGATSASYTAVAGDYGLTLYRRATYTNVTGDTVEDLAAPAVTGQQFFEDFGGMTAGDNTATVLAYGWTRTVDSDVQLGAVTEAEAPSGKGLEWWGTTSQARTFYRDDWDTFANANSGDPFEQLVLMKHQTSAARMFIRPHNGAGFVWTTFGAGFNIHGNNVYAQLPGDDPNATTGTFLRALTVGLYYWFRSRADGTLAQYKCWPMTDPEPSAWESRTHGSALVNRGPSIGRRVGTASDKQRPLYIASAHNAPAPFPVDFELPLPSSADAMTYAAPSSQSSFVQNGLITWSF